MTDNVLSCVFFYPGLFSLRWQCVWDLCHALKLSFFCPGGSKSDDTFLIIGSILTRNAAPNHDMAFTVFFTDGCRLLLPVS